MLAAGIGDPGSILVCASSPTARNLTLRRQAQITQIIRSDLQHSGRGSARGLSRIVRRPLVASGPLPITPSGRLMAQTQDATSKASTRKCRAKKKPLEEETPEDQTLITSAERKKRKGEL